MRLSRFLTASRTTTVPCTLTRAPRSGSARTKGTCNAARWTTFVIPCSSSAPPTAVRSVTSPETRVTRARSSSPRTSRSRASSPPRSNPTGSSPRSRSALSVQAPRQPSAPVTSVRPPSAKRSVLVDGDRFRVEVDRGSPVLVRTPGRALDPAERDVYVGTRGLRVHVDDPGLDLAREALCLAQVTCEDRGREPEADSVRPLDRLVERSVAVQRRDRAEHLLA